MWEYYIVRTEMWWIISRKKEVWKLFLQQFLDWKKNWVYNIWYAKVFYKQDDASGALAVMKRIWAKELS